MKAVRLNWQLLFSLLIFLNAVPTNAQSIIPAQDGTATLVTPNGQQYDISGGTLSGDGTNLFHSLEQFGLSQNEIANFISNPAILNIFSRVVGSDASLIDGTIQVTGGNANLFLMNPAGIIFGPQANLNVPASFTATTATGIGFDGGWFNATGANNYTQLGGTPNQFAFATSDPGSILNAGNLAVPAGENITLLGGTVVNTGILSAPGGSITIAAIPREKRVRISQAGMALSLEIEVLGQEAGLTPLPFQPQDLPALLTGGGLEQSTGVTVGNDDTLYLTGSNLALPADPGTTLISGLLDVSTSQQDATGGTINVLGEQIALVNGTLDASGPAGGGTALVGGDYQGQGTIPNAESVFFSDDSLINVDALTSGDGGRAIVWADDATRFFGTITARGGPQGGNGGFVETSGKNYLEVIGASVDASASNGLAGEWLLDPRNVTIGTMTSGGTFAGGVFTPTADDAFIDAAAINAALDAGLDVVISTGTSGSQEGDITVAAAITATFLPGGIQTLTLNAADDIIVNANITDADTTLVHALNVTLLAGGDITVNANIATRGGGITLTSTGGNIDTSLAFLNAGDGVTSGPSTVEGGKVSLTASGSIDTGPISSSAIVPLLGGGGNMVIGGDISLNAGSSIHVKGQINSSATTGNTSVSDRATAGDVSLVAGSTPGSNIIFDAIDALARVNGNGASTGGDISIVANGTVQGTGTLFGGATIEARGLNIAGANNTGTVAIQHDGGPNNIPFVVGDASQNGVAGPINAAADSLSSGSFPVLANGGSVTPANSTTITSINTSPTLTSSSNFTLSTSQPGQSLSFSVGSLLSASDINSDTLSLIVGFILNGTLTRNGVVLSPGDTLSAGDILVYTPPGGIVGTVNAFSIAASDGVSSSPLQTINATIASQESAILASSSSPLSLLAPQQGERVAERLPFRIDKPPCLNANARVVDLERHFTREFERYFSRGAKTQVKDMPIKDLKTIRRLLQDVEQSSGEKPAVLYAAFVCPDSITAHSGDSLPVLTKSLPGTTKKMRQLPPEAQLSVSEDVQTPTNPDRPARSKDQLALWLVTDRDDPARQFLTGVTREEIRQVSREFLREVTDPTQRQTQTYLVPAQQLYQWLVTPFEASLQAEGIENLAFVVDAGLRSLPLAALHNGEEFVVERYSLGLMPSVSLSDTRYASLTDDRVLAMGAAEFHPSQNQIPLPGVEVEVEAIGRQLPLSSPLLNQDFTFPNLKYTLDSQPSRIVHLATHADFRPGRPGNSYIQLWDSRLSLDSLPQLNLSQQHNVELLTLSACRTAVGDPEAELGFAGLAVQAGVKTAMGSLWYISDDGTIGLMTSFYEHLQNSPIKAEALRQAQLALIDGQVRLEAGQLITRSAPVPLPPAIAQRGTLNLSHPYYWSAFTTIGSPW